VAAQASLLTSQTGAGSVHEHGNGSESAGPRCVARRWAGRLHRVAQSQRGPLQFCLPSTSSASTTQAQVEASPVLRRLEVNPAPTALLEKARRERFRHQYSFSTINKLFREKPMPAGIFSMGGEGNKGLQRREPLLARQTCCIKNRKTPTPTNKKPLRFFRVIRDRATLVEVTDFRLVAVINATVKHAAGVSGVRRFGP